jgi:hypothetical protein
LTLNPVIFRISPMRVQTPARSLRPTALCIAISGAIFVCAGCGRQPQTPEDEERAEDLERIAGIKAQVARERREKAAYATKYAQAKDAIDRICKEAEEASAFGQGTEREISFPAVTVPIGEAASPTLVVQRGTVWPLGTDIADTMNAIRAVVVVRVAESEVVGGYSTTGSREPLARPPLHKAWRVRLAISVVAWPARKQVLTHPIDGYSPDKIEVPAPSANRIDVPAPTRVMALQDAERKLRAWLDERFQPERDRMIKLLEDADRAVRLGTAKRLLSLGVTPPLPFEALIGMALNADERDVAVTVLKQSDPVLGERVRMLLDPHARKFELGILRNGAFGLPVDIDPRLKPVLEWIRDNEKNPKTRDLATDVLAKLN